MTTDSSELESVKEISIRTLDILRSMEDVAELNDTACRSYQRICEAVPGQLESGRMKIAVVGVIKSGKSTLVNALVGKDLVKRGAGVITSITTRIQRGKRNQAVIRFKSWDQINTQLASALQHFPGDGWDGTMPDFFDLRRREDRSFLEYVYQQICRDLPASTELISPEALMIRHALNGFDDCRSRVQADETEQCLAGKEFDHHKAYTSNADKAFYVKDVCLEVYGKRIAQDVEIADCQGADAMDPSALEQVLDYMDEAGLILYCISSRNGLRSADVNFIRQIKKMGLLDHVLFVNNCDLTEHENLADLQKIENDIKQNLAYLVNAPRLFTFSSLYHLYEKNPSRLPKKEKARFVLWEQESGMVAFCENQFRQFNHVLHHIIENARQQYLLTNHLNRLDLILAELAQRSDMAARFLSAGAPERETALQSLSELQTNASRLESIMENSLDGAIGGLKKEIHLNMNAALAKDDLHLLEKTRQFIDRTVIHTDTYRTLPGETGFNRILYLMFQEFRRELDRHDVKQIKPVVKQFVKEQEEKIRSHFQSLLNSYQIDLIKSGFNKAVGEKNRDTGHEPSLDSVDVTKIKQILGLRLPGRMFTARYTPGIRAGVLAGFGFHTVLNMISSLLGRNSRFSFTPGLEKAASKMKHQTKTRLRAQFETYRHQLADHYFMPLIDAAAREFKQIIRSRFGRYKAFKQEMMQLLDLEETQKNKQLQKVRQIGSSIDTTREILISTRNHLKKSA